MPRNPWVALLAAFAVACGAGAAEIPAPPLPANLSTFDPRVVARIEEARAKVTADPHRAQAWAELGMVYSSERLKELALDCFGEAETLEPRQPKWPYRLGVTLAQLGRGERAAAALERSLALEPSYAPSHARLGNLRLELGDLDGAEREFQEANRLDSSYPGGAVGLARVALQRDHADEAVALLERLRAKDPDDRTFRQLLSVAKRQAGRGGEVPADEVLGEDEVPVWNDPWELEARAFRQNPSMLRVGRMLESGHASEALAALEAERARGSPKSETALQFVEAYRQLGRRADALAELQALLASEPENTAALLVQAQLLDDDGKLGEAVAALERVTRLQPSFGGAFAAKGKKLAQLGQHELAVESMQRAIELGIDDFELRYALGRSLIVLKRWKESSALFAALVGERAQNGDLWLELALARVHTGELDLALEALEKARATGTADARLFGDVESVVQSARARRARKAGENPGTETTDPAANPGGRPR